MHHERPRRRPYAALGLAALLVAAGSSALASTDHVLVATAGDMTQSGSKTLAPSGAVGVLSPGVVAKVLKVEQNLSKLGPRDTNLDMSRALNGTADTFQQWQAHLESNADTAAAIRSAGMTPKEYLRAYATIVQASAISRAKTSGKPVPDRIKRQVADADVAFVEAHSAELGTLAPTGAASVTPNTMEDIYVADDGAAKDNGKDKDSADAATAAADQGSKDSAKTDTGKKKPVKKP